MNERWNCETCGATGNEKQKNWLQVYMFVRDGQSERFYFCSRKCGCEWLDVPECFISGSATRQETLRYLKEENDETTME